VLEVALETERGGLHLKVECRLEAEWTVIFGPSGAGKSTLLRLLAGLDQPDRGQIALDGQPLTDTWRGISVRSRRRRSGLVAQQPALFPHLNAAANVAYGLDRWPATRRWQRVEEMLDLVGASELAERRPAQLSGGQAQRVALARALAPAPRLLLLDEPFSGLDGVASDRLLERLETWVRQNGVQSVLATHDVSDALLIRAEVLLLREGRQEALGPAATVLAEERSRLLGRLADPESRDPGP
jgi:ABC-type sulfate/molybdate transport systems ATPase subunit